MFLLTILMVKPTIGKYEPFTISDFKSIETYLTHCSNENLESILTYTEALIKNPDDNFRNKLFQSDYSDVLLRVFNMDESSLLHLHGVIESLLESKDKKMIELIRNSIDKN